MSAPDPPADPPTGPPADPTADPIKQANPDPFIEAVKGCVPLSKNVSAARTWARTGADDTGAYVPRPDIPLWLLKACSWGGMLGLDHFLLRSTTTGFLKLLLGLIFIVYISTVSTNSINWIIPMVLLLWVIWDILQVYCEPTRVMNYGMSLPFDFVTGIGQGIVTDKTEYKQNASFILWGITLIFGFIGLDSVLMGKPGVAFRKILDAIILYFTTKGVVNGQSGWLILVIPLCFFLVIPWLYNMFFFLFKPSEMFEKGIILPDGFKDLLNLTLFMFPPGQRNENTKDFKNENERQKDVIHEAMLSDVGYGSITAKEMNDNFSVLYPGEKEATIKTKHNSRLGRWVISLLVDNLYFGPISLGVWRLINWLQPLYTESVEQVYTGTSSISIPGIGSFASMIPGASTVASMMPTALPSAASLGLPTALPSALPTALSNPAAALNAARRASAGLPAQIGGARKEPLSTEAKILGAAVIALITGGGMKGLVDYLMKE